MILPPEVTHPYAPTRPLVLGDLPVGGDRAWPPQPQKGSCWRCGEMVLPLPRPVSPDYSLEEYYLCPPDENDGCIGRGQARLETQAREAAERAKVAAAAVQGAARARQETTAAAKRATPRTRPSKALQAAKDRAATKPPAGSVSPPALPAGEDQTGGQDG